MALTDMDPPLLTERDTPDEMAVELFPFQVGEFRDSEQEVPGSEPTIESGRWDGPAGRFQVPNRSTSFQSLREGRSRWMRG